MYCEGCASEPCISCPAAAVWDTEAQYAEFDIGHDEHLDQVEEERLEHPQRQEELRSARPSPDQATAMRIDKIHDCKRRRVHEREWNRQLRKEQIAKGRRPKRDRWDAGKYMFTSVNVTAVSSLTSEFRCVSTPQ